MRALVTGGAGYIGSFTVKALQAAGYDVVVFDNLRYGHRAAVDCPVIQGELADRAAIFETVAAQPFDCVLHFAAYASVPESVADPGLYARDNVGGSINLIDACVAHGIDTLIFSSTSEIYGEARYLPIDEAHPTEPVNPYGGSKCMVERFLRWYDTAYGLRSISLRYFNAAGAMPDGSMGEDHRPEGHLIPNAIRGALGIQEFQMTAATVDTPDGTPIRDFVHVLDLADAHVRALELLRDGHPTDAVNLGTGTGYSVRQVIDAVQRITGRSFPVERGAPRPGEPAAKYASNDKAAQVLGWRPAHDLESIIRSAVAWHSRHPNGYPEG